MPNSELQQFFLDLKESDAPVLLAALWAGMDVHSMLYDLTEDEHTRLEYLANTLNEVLTLKRDSGIIHS